MSRVINKKISVPVKTISDNYSSDDSLGFPNEAGTSMVPVSDTMIPSLDSHAIVRTSRTRPVDDISFLNVSSQVKSEDEFITMYPRRSLYRLDEIHFDINADHIKLSAQKDINLYPCIILFHDGYPQSTMALKLWSMVSSSCIGLKFATCNVNRSEQMKKYLSIIPQLVYMAKNRSVEYYKGEYEYHSILEFTISKMHLNI